MTEVKKLWKFDRYHAVWMKKKDSMRMTMKYAIVYLYVWIVFFLINFPTVEPSVQLCLIWFVPLLNIIFEFLVEKRNEVPAFIYLILILVLTVTFQLGVEITRIWLLSIVSKTNCSMICNISIELMLGFTAFNKYHVLV